LEISCASTPAVEETPLPAQQAQPAAPVVETTQPPQLVPVDTTPTQTSLDALNTAKAAAEQARKQALDIGCDLTCPDDWSAAEALYKTASDAPHGIRDEVTAAIAMYQAALEAYDGIFQNGLPAYVQLREVELENARQAALEAGIEAITPEYLAMADTVVDEARAQYGQSTYYSASDTAYQALLLYQALKVGADAYNTREQIVWYDLAKYDQENFDDTDALGLEAIADYEHRNGKDALAKASTALSQYGRELTTAWQLFATERGLAASQERQHALSLKANVAVRGNFNASDEVYHQALAAFGAGQFSVAVDEYTHAEVLFADTARSAAEKRQAAEDAIRAAEQKTNESDSIAQNAAIILEGGSR
jgi:hypothetical protein